MVLFGTLVLCLVPLSTRASVAVAAVSLHAGSCRHHQDNRDVADGVAVGFSRAERLRILGSRLRGDERPSVSEE